MVRNIIIKRTAGNANPRVAHAAKKAHRRKQPVVANPARQQRASARVQRLIAQLEEREAQLPDRVTLAVLSGVLANVPVTSCAIIRAARRAFKAGFRAGELLVLAYVKVPCAIDWLVGSLPASYGERTQEAWAEQAAAAITHFGARCCGSGSSLGGMDPTYRKQRAAVCSPGMETTTGLVFLHDEQIGSRSAGEFQQLREWEPDWQKQPDGIGKSIGKGTPLGMRGSDYKLAHAARTVMAAMGADRPARSGDTPIKMSGSLVAARERLFPPSARGCPKAAAVWFYRQCKRKLESLGVPRGNFTPLLHALKAMTRGDEGCLVCEAAHVAAAEFTPEQISAMEWAIKTAPGLAWRWGVAWGEGAIVESRAVGVFAGVKESAAALAKLHQQAMAQAL